ncbi:MAG: DCC1-like thiol-disulfide oxidoreductase family protein [Stellaceae bacterium]
MSSIEDDTADVWVVYDGECPFCRSYVQLYRLRDRMQVHLIDARTPHPLVTELKARRINLDLGMAVRFNDRLYHGAEAMNLLAVLGSGDTIFNIVNRILFRHRRLARLLYPALVKGRLLTLRLLGRRLIGEHQA